MTIRLLASILCICAAGFVLRRAAAGVSLRASRTVDEIERACGADPHRADCWSRLAEARETLGMDAADAWRRSLDANPRDARSLTQAAAAAETRGDPQSAERLLLDAARYNQLWLPRWTLANFYLRQKRTNEFWGWMHSAFERSYGDPTAAFRLSFTAGATSDFLLRHILPQEPGILDAFVHYLINEKRYADVEPAAMEYARQAGPEDRAPVASALTAAADALLVSHRLDGALRIWNDLSRRGYIPYSAWSAESPLVNGNFQSPLPSPGFDWRAGRTEGVTAIFGAPMDGVKITLSGRQPVNAEVLSQYIVLAPGRNYRFAFDYQTPQIAAGESAFYWKIGAIHSNDLADSNDWEHASMRFATLPSDRLTLEKLTLVAGRREGSARMQGEVWIRRARLESTPNVVDDDEDDAAQDSRR